MCTAISFLTNEHYFGRNLDYEILYNQEIIITPRNFPLIFRQYPNINNHYAIIGMGIYECEYPLYFDATNEKGLSIAGLNFKENAVYNHSIRGLNNIASFEFIPWILSQCSDIIEVKKLLEKTNITDEPFSEKYAPSQLHWMISDRKNSLTVESTADGLKIYDNPVGVLTNNPKFEMQMFNLNNYMNLSAYPIENNFSEEIDFVKYSRGMGAIGLPGDLSSMSRFVKAVFTKANSICEKDEFSSICQFFHILESVLQQKGCTRLDDGKYEYTQYISCCNTDQCIYYYKTYSNSQINAVKLKSENLNTNEIMCFPLILTPNINYHN